MTELFGVPVPLERAQARMLSDHLSALLTHQANSANVDIRPPAEVSRCQLAVELGKFKTWFDPTAKGGRLRSLLANLEVLGRGMELPGLVAIDLGGGRCLLTPEGYALLWLLARAQAGDTIVMERSDVDAAKLALLELYRGWSRQRLDDVVGLLASETSTLRPAAAGLLFTLLMNRNTAPGRALTRPRNTEALEQVAGAIASPALAYGSTLGGKTTARASLDLYRGWALGELRRRLGPGFHSNLDDGIWLDEATVEIAERRLVEDVQRRDAKARDRVAGALDAAVAAYERERPKLAALNLAFEQPGNTLRLRRLLEGAAAPTDRK